MGIMRTMALCVSVAGLVGCQGAPPPTSSPEFVVTLIGDRESVALAARDLDVPVGAVIVVGDPGLEDVLDCTKGAAVIYVSAPNVDLSGSEARLEENGWDCELTDDTP